MDAVAAALAAWNLPAPLRLAPLGGGRNSETWRVVCPAGVFVAKSVAPAGAGFEAGLLIAEHLERAGFRAGGPLRTRAGRVTVRCGAGALALLRFAAGRPVDPTRAEELRCWGETLGRGHALLRALEAIPAGLARWPWAWLDPTAAHVDRAPWLRQAVTRAVAEVRALEDRRPLTLGVLHGDGAPVLLAPPAPPAIIDWGAVLWGPLLYDLGSAQWFFEFEQGQPAAAFAPFFEGYAASGPLPAAELGHAEAFVRLRCAVQGWYYAWRLAGDVRTGLAAPAENERGLEQARRAWVRLEARAASLGARDSVG